MDRLIPYVSYAQRSEQLKYCFRNFFNEADKIKIEIDPNAKNVFQTSGAHIIVPSKIIDTYLIRAPNLIWAVRLKMLMIII